MTRQIGKYKLKVKNYLDSESDKVVVSLEVNSALKELLKFWACEEDPTTTSEHYGVEVERYLIKNILHNSIYWRPSFNFLFDVKLLRDGQTKQEFESLESYKDFVRGLTEVKDLIKSAEELRQEGEITFEVITRRAN